MRHLFVGGTANGELIHTNGNPTWRVSVPPKMPWATKLPDRFHIEVQEYNAHYMINGNVFYALEGLTHEQMDALMASYYGIPLLLYGWKRHWLTTPRRVQ